MAPVATTQCGVEHPVRGTHGESLWEKVVIVLPQSEFGIVGLSNVEEIQLPAVENIDPMHHDEKSPNTMLGLLRLPGLDLNQRPHD